MGFFKRLSSVQNGSTQEEWRYLSFGRLVEVGTDAVHDDIVRIWRAGLERIDPLLAVSFSFWSIGDPDIIVRTERVGARRFKEYALGEGVDYAVDAYLSGVPVEAIIQPESLGWER